MLLRPIGYLGWSVDATEKVGVLDYQCIDFYFTERRQYVCIQTATHREAMMVSADADKTGNSRLLSRARCKQARDLDFPLQGVETRGAANYELASYSSSAMLSV
jgi:hypothetical protein